MAFDIRNIITINSNDPDCRAITSAVDATESRFGDAEVNLHDYLPNLDEMEERREAARDEAKEVAAAYEKAIREWGCTSATIKTVDSVYQAAQEKLFSIYELN